MRIEIFPTAINRRKVEIPLQNGQRLITYSGEATYSHKGVSDSVYERF